MNDDTQTTYGFTYVECDGKKQTHEVTVSEATWPEVLNDFVNFLEGVYGYEIKSSIRVKEPFWVKYDETPISVASYYESHGWQGEFFSEDE